MWYFEGNMVFLGKDFSTGGVINLSVISLPLSEKSINKINYVY